MRLYELKTSNIEVETEIGHGLPEVMVDFHQIQQVFLNIILNAEQAMSESNHGGKLLIKVQKKEDYIRIEFTDNGPGIPKNNIERIFDPFFTARGGKGGTGLGLSICHGIVTEHDGKIYARSEPGKGTSFFIELPFVA
jgi:signal transduction histidine kinase